jgi:hypothetical protein
VSEAVRQDHSAAAFVEPGIGKKLFFENLVQESGYAFVFDRHPPHAEHKDQDSRHNAMHGCVLQLRKRTRIETWE